jgi:hypothetical protein
MPPKNKNRPENSRSRTESDVEEVEFDEVIGPDRDLEGEKRQKDFSGGIAKVLDDLFRVPGTDRRFGIDPLLGLLPFAGDALGMSAASAILITAASQGVPKIVLVRMCVNVFINAAVGAIPGVGDAFSFWFKSNVRNHHMLMKHARGSHVSTKKDWIFVGFLLAGLVIILLGSLFIYASLVAWIFGNLFGWGQGGAG